MNNRLPKEVFISFVLLFVILISGAIGYHLIEGMDLFDGFYMTFITITTIGFGEVQKLSHGGRALTMMISVLGIGVIAYIASKSTQLILESLLFKERTIKKRIEKMENHYIVCGYGRIGRRIVDELINADLPVVVIDNKDEIVEQLVQTNINVVRGNAQKEEMLKLAQISKARALICTLSRDEDNVFVTLVARELNPDLFILVRTNHLYNSKKILRAGADKVISPYDIGADRMANVILKPHVDLFLEQLSKDESEDNAFEELLIAVDSPFVNKTLAEINIRQKHDVLIVAIIPASSPNKFMFNPKASYRFEVGDTLIVLGQKKEIDAIRIDLCNDTRSSGERNKAIDRFLKRLRKNKV